MYSEEDVKKHPLWLHRKTGGLYFVVGSAMIATNGLDNGKEVIVYYALKSGENQRRLAVRDRNEFFDGRFVPCEANGKPVE